MNVEYINPFIQSTIDTFDRMLELKINAGKPALKTDSSPLYDISAVIGLSGSITGNAVFSCPKEVALKIVSSFIKEEIKIVGPDLVDGMSEIINIIAGAASGQFKDKSVSISLPNVVIGQNHDIKGRTMDMSICVPFTTKFGEFSLEINFKDS